MGGGIPPGGAPPPRPRRSGWRRGALLVCVYLGFAVAAELVLWAAGVERLVDREDPFHGFSGLVPVFVRDGSLYRTRPSSTPTTFNDQSFLAEKPDDGLRLFTLGGSSAYGFPWGAEISFTGVLADVLADARPDRRVEVVNAAGLSYAMHRLNLVADEILGYEPDLLIVYSGHNEFIEPAFFDPLRHRSAVRNRLEYALFHSRLYSGARQLLGSRESRRVETAEEYGLLAQRDLSQVFDPAQKAEIARAFRSRLERLVRRAHERGARVLLASVPANLRDWHPDRSWVDPSLSEARRRSWREAVESGRAQLEAGQPESAIGALDRALAIAPEHAESHYLRARALEALERWDEARRDYELACDLDASPQRRSSAINAAIREVAEAEGALFVDVDGIFADNSPHGLVGFDLIEDYVHPTPEGHRLIAWQLWQAMVREGWLGADVVASRARFEAAAPPRAPVANSGNRVWLFNQGVILEHQGRDALAMERYRQALAADPRYDAALWNLARLELEHGSRERAAELLRRFLVLRPERQEAHLLHAETLLRLGRRDEARAALQALLVRSPELPEARMQLAILREGEGDHAAARAEYERALAARPDYDRAHHNLGALLYRIGELAAAERHLERAAELTPGRADTQYLLGLVAEARGQPARAREHYERALSRRPGYLAAQNNLAWMLATARDPSLRDGEAALRWARKVAARAGPDDLASLDTLAAACAEAGRFEEAVKWQSRAVELAPEPERAGYAKRLALYRARRPYRAP